VSPTTTTSTASTASVSYRCSLLLVVLGRLEVYEELILDDVKEKVDL
jgi:hypothetical protein